MHISGLFSQSKRGIATWYNLALASFFVIAVALAGTIMNSGFTSSDATKEVLMEALDETRYGLEIVGAISANADVANDQIITTASPVAVATGGSIDLSLNKFKLNYKLIKVESHIITYDDIYVGPLTNKIYNSIQEAVVDAKSQGLIDVNPYVDEQKPTTTSAFIYWIVNSDFDSRIDSGEVAIIAIIYAEQDRPSTGEYLLIEGIKPEGNILTMERTIPNISSSSVNLGGKINE